MHKIAILTKPTENYIKPMKSMKHVYLKLSDYLLLTNRGLSKNLTIVDFNKLKTHLIDVILMVVINIRLLWSSSIIYSSLCPTGGHVVTLMTALV